MNRVVLTGPTGAIGIALIQFCIQKEVDIYAICRKNSKRKGNIPQNPLVHIIECDLDELRYINTDKLKKCDVFFHLGWDATIGDGRNNVELQLKNVQYTLDAADLAKRFGCSVFIGAGSQAEYGRQRGKINGSTAVFPENGYGIAKLCAGQMSRIVCQRLGICHIWARILSVYGPWDNERTMVISLIHKLLQGEKPALTKGEQKWDYLYSEDAARALFLLGEHGKDSKVYCVGSGTAVQLLDYIFEVRDAVNPNAELGIGEIPYGEQQIMHLCADIRELTEDTGFTPKVTFKEGIRNTIAWVKMGL